MEYNKNFALSQAYSFLNQHGLSEERIEIQNSPDSFKSYTSTLRRAKIVLLAKNKNLLEDFYHEVWPSGLTDKGKVRTRFFENLIARFNADQDGFLGEDDETEIDDVQLIDSVDVKEFAYENDLRNFLVKNLFKIEVGLKLYEGPDGTKGEEFFIPGTARRIDILASDKNNNLVVIELKVSRGYERVVGQTLYYQSMIKTHFSQQKVRAIIIAREISAELKAATQFLPDFELFEYELALTLNKVK